MAERILVVDDEQEIADLVEVYLQNEGYHVYKYYAATPALKCAESCDIDLAILDVMLPDVSGFEVCRRLREKHTFPILMLTAKVEESDKINGLALGADDYVTKPFRPLELVARVKAHLRRYKHYNPAQIPDSVLIHKGIVLNVDTHECRLDDRPISLTPTEFSLLRILLERRGSVVSAEELFKAIWQDECYCKTSNTISVHVRHLREKLKDTAENPKYIRTVWGVGYQIERE